MAFVLALVLITIVNVSATQTRASYSLARDTRRLRRALKAELAELAFLYAGNLQRLRSGEKILLSSRSCTSVYRGSIARLTSIPDKQIAPLVRAYAVSEQVEHLVAATTKPSSPLAYRLVDGETPVDELIREMERSQRCIEAALLSMGLPDETSGRDG